MSYECLYRATIIIIGLIENERGSLDRVPSIVRRASSATPVPVVNETLSLLLSGLRLSFDGFQFLWARQYWYSVDVALAAFGLREG